MKKIFFLVASFFMLTASFNAAFADSPGFLQFSDPPTAFIAVVTSKPDQNCGSCHAADIPGDFIQSDGIARSSPWHTSEANLTGKNVVEHTAPAAIKTKVAQGVHPNHFINS